MHKLYWFLISFLLLLVGLLALLFGAAAFGPQPLPAWNAFPASLPYYIQVAGGYDLLIGVVYLFPVTKRVVLIGSTLLIVLNLFPLIGQLMAHDVAIIMALIVPIVLGLVTYLLPLRATHQSPQ